MFPADGLNSRGVQRYRIASRPAERRGRGVVGEVGGGSGGSGGSGGAVRCVLFGFVWVGFWFVLLCCVVLKPARPTEGDEISAARGPSPRGSYCRWGMRGRVRGVAGQRSRSSWRMHGGWRDGEMERCGHATDTVVDGALGLTVEGDG